MIERYNIVASDKTIELIRIVNEMIAQGWQPEGSMVVDSMEDGWFYQTMVKHEEQTETPYRPPAKRSPSIVDAANSMTDNDWAGDT